MMMMNSVSRCLIVNTKQFYCDKRETAVACLVIVTACVLSDVTYVGAMC